MTQHKIKLEISEAILELFDALSEKEDISREEIMLSCLRLGLSYKIARIADKKLRRSGRPSDFDFLHKRAILMIRSKECLVEIAKAIKNTNNKSLVV